MTTARHRHKSEDIIKIAVEEIYFENVKWIQLIQDSLQWLVHVNTVMNLCIP
jgi:hypothetical protein